MELGEQSHRLIQSLLAQAFDGNKVNGKGLCETCVLR